MSDINKSLYAAPDYTPAQRAAAVEQYRKAAALRANCECYDGTATCRSRKLPGGVVWQCDSCSREWIVPETHHVEEDVGYWGSLLVAAAIIGSGLLLAIGFGGGWLARGWWA